MDSKEIQAIYDNLSEETKALISSLPEKQCQGKIYNYQGCWYNALFLQGVLNFQRGFKPQDTDIIIASFPKSGTTWLKALTFALRERSKNSSSDDLHPLLSNNPHDLVPFFEMNMYSKSSEPDLSKLSLSSPRLFSTHMPLNMLQVALKDSPCKIVYVCRDVKDVIASRLYFACAFHKKEVDKNTLESLFESFCNGVTAFGPIWEHVLSYWTASLEDSKHFLFMRYEEIKAEPVAQVKTLQEKRLVATTDLLAIPSLIGYSEDLARNEVFSL